MNCDVELMSVETRRLINVRSLSFPHLVELILDTEEMIHEQFSIASLIILKPVYLGTCAKMQGTHQQLGS